MITPDPGQLQATKHRELLVSAQDPGAKAFGSGSTEPESFARWFHSRHGDSLLSSHREQAAVEHGHLHDDVLMAVCCLLVRDALAGVGGIRL